MRVHLDTDVLVFAPSQPGPERKRLRELAASEAEIQISAVAWYEFSRGSRTAEQLAVARSFFLEDGIVSLSEELAALAAEVFRRLSSPRRRAADVAIGVTAASPGAVLFRRYARDFAGIPHLEFEAVGCVAARSFEPSPRARSGPRRSSGRGPRPALSRCRKAALPQGDSDPCQRLL